MSLQAALGLVIFFTAMTFAEGGGRRAVAHKMRDMYLPTLKANYMVWPAVQIINFRLMPIQLQVVSIYPLALIYNQADATEAVRIQRGDCLDSLPFPVECS